MSRIRGIALRLAMVVLLLTLGSLSRPTRTLTVAPGDDIHAVLEALPEGSTLRLAEGDHEGPLLIDKTLTLEGEPGARLVAPMEADAALHVTAEDVRISDLHVIGGWTGIEFDDARGSSVRNVRVTGADLQGIRIYKAAATLDSVSVSGLLDPHAQGIEVLSAPDVVVRNSDVTGGKVGIVGHLSDTHFENNRVTGTTLAGIMIREMGTGTAYGNEVLDVAGAGLYCGDMSLCAFENNRVERVAAASNAVSGSGWGLVVNYRSTASTRGGLLSGEAGEVISLGDSRIEKTSPLRFGDGARAIWPAAIATLAALLGVALLYLLARKVFPEGRSRRPLAGTAGAVAAGTALLLVGIGVQSFHMLEHVIQLYRVKMDGLPSRGALVGSVVDTEWVHFTYNALVVVGLGALLLLRRRGWNPPGRNLVRGDRLILAAVLLQSYHVVEHSLKVAQHVVTGAKVNPGILGNHFDLVLLHFGLNAAIYAAFIAAAIVYLWPQRPLQPSLLVRRSHPTPT